MMLSGVGAPLSALGVVDPADSLALFGVTVSRSDTAIGFPEDFQIDDDIDYELPATQVIEGGLGAGMAARAYVAAIDRNTTNWIRDQVFNPSGQVRIPSLRGDGTGVFGSSVVIERRLASAPSGCAP